MEEFFYLPNRWDEVEHFEYDSELQDELLRENSSVADAENLDIVPVHSNDQMYIELQGNV